MANPYLRVFLVGMLAHASMAGTTIESERVLAADTTVDVAAGDTLKIGVLSGNYTLTKTGGGELVVYSVAQPTSGGTSISLEGGTLSFALNDRPTAAMSSAYLHLDASQTNTMRRFGLLDLRFPSNNDRP